MKTRKPPKKPTIRDVAIRAGVSTKTVSHALNGKPGLKNETRARVLGVIEELGYHPHMGARILRCTQRGSIGVAVPVPLDVVRLSEYFFLWVFEELFRVFGARGEYVTFDMNPYASGIGGGDYARGVWEQLYKACVLVGPLASNDTTVKRIHESGTPYLAMGRLDGFPECSCSTVDYESATYLSAKFLLDRGHKRVGMLKTLQGFQPGVERRRGYLKALAEANVSPDEHLVRTVSFGAQNIANMVHRILANQGVTALVDCSSTEDAAGLREGARRAGRVLGKDVEIVVWTFENNATVLSEASAHVWLPARAAASEGIEQLAAWVEGKREGPIQIVYQPILQEKVANGEIPRPRRLFDLVD